MLDANSSQLAHDIQNLALIAFSFIALPLTTFVLFVSYQLRWFRKDGDLRSRQVARSDRDFRPKTILVTGVGMTKGLALARLFYCAGHDVIGADFEPGQALVCGRVSEAVKKFYRLQAPSADAGTRPYLQSLLDTIKREKVDLWVSCSGVASAVEDGLAMQVVEARTACKAIQFDARTTQMLHEKHTFIERVRELGLTVPETFEITSAKQVESVLANARGKKYIMKTIGVDDSVRADMTLLPKDNPQDTSRHISQLKIDSKTPWIVQQFIDGVEFCTHSLVVDGMVKAFVACPSAELLMHYQALPGKSPLSLAMLAFTNTVAQNSGPNFTGHLSFDFLVQRDDLTKTDFDGITLYPIECNPRAHTAVALFEGMTEMADAYLSALESSSSPSKNENRSYADVVDEDPARHVIIPSTTSTTASYYWTGHDLFTLFFIPLANTLLLRTTVSKLLGCGDALLDHLLTWKDGTYEVWDPLPWWWLYHVYWPLRFWDMFWRRKKWSRINVSTGKMFEC